MTKNGCMWAGFLPTFLSLLVAVVLFAAGMPGFAVLVGLPGIAFFVWVMARVPEDVQRIRGLQGDAAAQRAALAAQAASAKISSTSPSRPDWSALYRRYGERRVGARYQGMSEILEAAGRTVTRDSELTLSAGGSMASALLVCAFSQLEAGDHDTAIDLGVQALATLRAAGETDVSPRVYPVLECMATIFYVSGQHRPQGVVCATAASEVATAMGDKDAAFHNTAMAFDMDG
ncbi:MAG: hypothetical protein CVT66_11435 [Actinobacteria bacterium HGW-Actinobacteria-6]|jgi:hypothetical protein|nr:MAG: hypothetical protein CVT66_11435 [Actinobacteria bacterium HGW-Actinobacteria-6]